jgi:hypothetical protein
MQKMVIVEHIITKTNASPLCIAKALVFTLKKTILAYGSSQEIYQYSLSHSLFGARVPLGRKFKDVWFQL